MKVKDLVPLPTNKEAFRRAETRFIKDVAGCYVLANFDEEILYVGLAKNLRRRFVQHLDTAEKVAATALGRAVWFFWLECDDLPKVERTWMNIHQLQHAKLPILNKVYSPTSV
jgi:hypothetical protein